MKLNKFIGNYVEEDKRKLYEKPLNMMRVVVAIEKL